MKQLITICCALLVAEAAQATEQNVLRLRSQVTAAGQGVTLAELVDLSAAAPELTARLAASVILEASVAQPIATLTHDELIERLHQLGINRATLLLTGALTCTVTFPELEVIDDDPETQGTSARNSVFRVGASQATHAAGSLAEQVRAYLAREFSEDGGEVEVQFERASQAFLDLTSPTYEFSLRSTGRRKLGPRQVRATIRRDGRTQRTVELFVQVRLVKQVAVAKRPLNVGSLVEADDLRLERHIFDSHEAVGLDDVNVLVGQQVSQFVAAGAQLKRESLKSVDLVKRSRPVTLVGSSVGVRATVTGVALDSGEYGDEVRVRLGDQRRGRRVLRGIVTGVGTVRLINS